mmetsp:Transcript_14602/g.40169  ORF Transcript_14602/g.40169 Transcript_14602/m.40169 type:complete len:243 (+) Transcript_14602:414-1142(+)
MPRRRKALEPSTVSKPENLDVRRRSKGTPMGKGGSFPARTPSLLYEGTEPRLRRGGAAAFHPPPSLRAPAPPQRRPPRARRRSDTPVRRAPPSATTQPNEPPGPATVPCPSARPRRQSWSEPPKASRPGRHRAASTAWPPEPRACAERRRGSRASRGTDWCQHALAYATWALWRRRRPLCSDASAHLRSARSGQDPPRRRRGRRRRRRHAAEHRTAGDVQAHERAGSRPRPLARSANAPAPR